MSKLQHASCPRCGKTAKNEKEVIARFGIRNNGGHIMVQSWCRICRSRYS